MRTIKFKGKSVDSSEWIEGYYYKECDNTYIIKDRQSDSGHYRGRTGKYWRLRKENTQADKRLSVHQVHLRQPHEFHINKTRNESE